MASLHGQESQPEPMVLPGPSDGGKGGQSGSVSLVHESSKANKITDDENWWKVNELEKPMIYQRFPAVTKGKAPTDAPENYRGANLVAAWKTANGVFLAYGESIYRAKYLLVTGSEGKVAHHFDAREYGNVAWSDLINGMLYLTSNPGNLSAGDGGGARIFAIDLKTKSLKWSSDEKVCHGQFVVVAGSVICSYGFTGEPDAITVFDRFTGDHIQKVKLKTAASWMIPKGERLYVRCYNTEEVFRVVLRD